MVIPDSSDGDWAECSAPPGGSDPNSNASNNSNIRAGHALDIRPRRLSVRRLRFLPLHKDPRPLAES